MAPKKLDAEDIQNRLADLDGWSIQNEKLHKKLQFSDFAEAFGFMTRVALVAEDMQHHPEWQNVWNRVTIDLTTHDAGGISEKDFTLASKIDSFSA